jgi:uncharacterized ferritin-like protein (DUF455 family)
VTALCDDALAVLTQPDPVRKAETTLAAAARWRADAQGVVGTASGLPARPARPARPELRLPRDMPKRRRAGSPQGKIALLHALAHIELNAIDLAWDIMARFSSFPLSPACGGEGRNAFTLPRAFFDDWIGVAADEAKHFLMLSARLKDFGAAYGDLPAHDGLWESSERTAHDFAARLAIVPMVLEARGLDVTPAMIANMKAQGDMETAAMLQTIHDDEITHVRAGTVWFEEWCRHHGRNVETTWQNLVRNYFTGPLKRPFNDPSREKAGMLRHWYEPLAD